MAEIEDITDRFDDLNDWDLIFSSPSGYTVKIKTERMVGRPDIAGFRISGSWVDDQTGKAKAFGDEYFIVTPDEQTIQVGGDPVDVEGLLKTARHAMVRKVEAAILNHVAVASIPGVREPTPQ